MFSTAPHAVGDFLIYTHELDRQKVQHVDCYSGSGFKIGLFSAHAHRAIMKPDFIMGGSGGAITAACRSMGEEGLEVYDRLLGQIDDGKKWDGIDGWLSDAKWNLLAHFFFPPLAKKLRIRESNGLFFSDGIQEKIRKYVDPKKFRCPVGFAVVVRGLGYRVIVCGPDTPPDIVHDACISSALIALAMDTPETDIRGIGPATNSDGGHEVYCPLPTLELFPNLRSLDAVLARQVGKPVAFPRHKNPFIASVLWFISQAMSVPVARDMDRLHALSTAGVGCRGYAPLIDPGDTFDAGREIMDARVEHSYELLKKPFLVPVMRG